MSDTSSFFSYPARMGLPHNLYRAYASFPSPSTYGQVTGTITRSPSPVAPPTPAPLTAVNLARHTAAAVADAWLPASQSSAPDPSGVQSPAIYFVPLPTTVNFRGNNALVATPYLPSLLRVDGTRIPVGAAAAPLASSSVSYTYESSSDASAVFFPQTLPHMTSQSSILYSDARSPPLVPDPAIWGPLPSLRNTFPRPPVVASAAAPFVPAPQPQPVFQTGGPPSYWTSPASSTYADLAVPVVAEPAAPAPEPAPVIAPISRRPFRGTLAALLNGSREVVEGGEEDEWGDGGKEEGEEEGEEEEEDEDDSEAFKWAKAEASAVVDDIKFAAVGIWW